MNILKWELTKRMYHLRWIILSYLLLIGILYILPTPGGIGFEEGLPAVLSFSSMLITIASAYIVLIYPTLAIITDFTKKYGLLEKTHSQPFILTATARVIINIAIVLVGSGLFCLASEVMKRFHTETTKFLILNLTISYESLLLTTAVILPVVALFAYIVSSSVSPLKRHTIISAIIIFAVLLATIMMVTDLPAHISVIAQCILIVVAFLSSCWLYDNKYEITN